MIRDRWFDYWESPVAAIVLVLVLSWVVAFL